MQKFCSCFKANNDDRKKNKQINKESDVKSNGQKGSDFNLVLVGDDESGKTKIVEELVASHDPFTLREKVFKTSDIERYIRDSLTDILRAFEQNNPPVQLEHSANQRRVTYILTTAHRTNFEYPLEFFEHVEILWADAGLQSFMKQSDEHRFPASAKYFLDRVSNISDPDYIPTSEDMMHSRLFPSDVCKMSFDLKDEGLRLDLLELDLLRKEQQETIQSFRKNPIAILFITDCSCFDLIISEKGCQTRLHQSLDLFKTIKNHKWLKTTPVILLLNKQDLLAQKINNGVRLEDYFPDFAGFVLPGVEPDSINSDEDSEVTRAKYFIQDQFRKANINCYPHFTCDDDITVRLILDDHRAIVQKT